MSDQPPDLKVKTADLAPVDKNDKHGVSPLSPDDDEEGDERLLQDAETAAGELFDDEPKDTNGIEVNVTLASPTSPDDESVESGAGMDADESNDGSSGYLTVDTQTNASGNTTEEGS
jgi:hypothetical protein